MSSGNRLSLSYQTNARLCAAITAHQIEKLRMSRSISLDNLFFIWDNEKNELSFDRSTNRATYMTPVSKILRLHALYIGITTYFPVTNTLLVGHQVSAFMIDRKLYYFNSLGEHMEQIIDLQLIQQLIYKYNILEVVAYHGPNLQAMNTFGICTYFARKAITNKKILEQLILFNPDQVAYAVLIYTTFGSKVKSNAKLLNIVNKIQIKYGGIHSYTGLPFVATIEKILKRNRALGGSSMYVRTRMNNLITTPNPVPMNNNNMMNISAN